MTCWMIFQLIRKSKEGSLDAEIEEQCKLCYERMSDDFNTAQVLAALFELVSKINAIHNKQLDEHSASETYISEDERNLSPSLLLKSLG